MSFQKSNEMKLITGLCVIFSNWVMISVFY